MRPYSERPNWSMRFKVVISVALRRRGLAVVLG